MLGYSRFEMTGRSSDALYSAQDVGTHVPEKDRDAASATAIPGLPLDRQLVCRNGSTLSVRSSITALRDGPTLRGFVLLLRPATAK